MNNEELINVVEVVFTRAQKSGILELNEVPTLLQTISILKEKLELLKTLEEKEIVNDVVK